MKNLDDDDQYYESDSDKSDYEDSDYEDSGYEAKDTGTVKLNRKMRTWNRYKKFIIIAALCVIVIVTGVVVSNVSSGKKKSADSSVAVATTKAQSQNNGSATTAAATTAKNSATTANADTTAATTTAAATTAAAKASSGSVTVSGSAEAGVSFTAADFYDNAILTGDAVFLGASYYSVLDDSKVYASENDTVSAIKSNYFSSIVDANPGKVIINIGINELNYGTYTAELLASNIEDLAAEFKSSLPNASIYVVSIMPVSASFDSSSNVKQANIDSVNSLLSEAAADKGYTFVNVSDAFKGSDGYKKSDISGYGSSISADYYPFLLNGIAEAK